MTKGSITEKCGLRKDMTLAWVIDEFDDSFDRLAMASLRYHLYHSVASNEGPYGDKLLALLRDFEHLHRPRTLPGTDDDRDHFLNVHCEIPFPECDRCDDYADQIVAVEKQDRATQTALRHRFVELLPGLWS